MSSAARPPASKNAPNPKNRKHEGFFLPTACHSSFERRARAKGYTLVAGVDEVGRGCLFGPVVAAAVILPPRHGIRGLDDSKQLEPEVRVELSAKIRAKAVAFAIAQSSVEEIERVNIYQASRLAMRRAVEALSPRPDYLLVDAVTIDFDLPQRGIIKGDAQSHSIAAASIIAKVHRDALMAELDAAYPGYGLARNKGYGTPEHLDALTLLGPTALHRRTFEPVRQMNLFENYAMAAAAGAP